VGFESVAWVVVIDYELTADAAGGDAVDAGALAA